MVSPKDPINIADSLQNMKQDATMCVINNWPDCKGLAGDTHGSSWAKARDGDLKCDFRCPFGVVLTYCNVFLCALKGNKSHQTLTAFHKLSFLFKMPAPNNTPHKALKTMIGINKKTIFV